MRSGTYFVRQYSRSIRSHYTVLLATRHHRMVEAATFLAANVSLAIGSRNGKTAGRLDSSTLLRIVLFRRAPFCVWKCWSILPLFLPLARISRSDRLSFRFIPLRTFDPPFIRSFTCPPILFVIRRIHSYIHSSRCTLSYYFVSIFFAFVVSTKLFFLLFSSVRI